MTSASDKHSRKPVILIAGIVAALFCSAGIATIMDWGVSSGKTPGERTSLISLLSGGGANRDALDRRHKHHAVAVARPAARCAGCGVIESILTVDTRDDARDEATGICAAGDWIDHAFRDNASAGAGFRNLATLSEIVADVVVRNGGAKNMQSATGYELTIRFRNGTRSTIRLANGALWKPGDRILVIDNQT